jgi:hypothetical protein
MVPVIVRVAEIGSPVGASASNFWRFHVNRVRGSVRASRRNRRGFFQPSRCVGVSALAVGFELG